VLVAAVLSVDERAMSMQALYVEISTDELAGLHDDPSSLVALFMDSDPDFGGGNGHRSLSLEKAWHGLHYLLSGQAEPQASPLGSVILGGTEIGDDEFGYGEARYFPPDEVATIAAELEGTDEGELMGRYEPEQMTALSIYPFGWQADDRDWLRRSFRELRWFFKEAGARGSAVVTTLL
jgi:hypothetical protein